MQPLSRALRTAQEEMLAMLSRAANQHQAHSLKETVMRRTQEAFRRSMVPVAEAANLNKKWRRYVKPVTDGPKRMKSADAAPRRCRSVEYAVPPRPAVTPMEAAMTDAVAGRYGFGRDGLAIRALTQGSREVDEVIESECREPAD